VKVEKSSGDGVREEKKFAHSTMNLNPGHQLAAILTDSGVPRGGGGVWGLQTPPLPRNSERPPKSFQTQPDCEKC